MIIIVLRLCHPAELTVVILVLTASILMLGE
jgi:hypothetical protein